MFCVPSKPALFPPSLPLWLNAYVAWRLFEFKDKVLYIIFFSFVLFWWIILFMLQNRAFVLHTVQNDQIRLISIYFTPIQALSALWGYLKYYHLAILKYLNTLLLTLVTWLNSTKQELSLFPQLNFDFILFDSSLSPLSSWSFQRLLISAVTLTFRFYTDLTSGSICLYATLRTIPPNHPYCCEWHDCPGFKKSQIIFQCLHRLH